MLALKICDVKQFTRQLFIGETFDSFLVKEASVVTFNTFPWTDGFIGIIIPKRNWKSSGPTSIPPGGPFARFAFP